MNTSIRFFGAGNMATALLKGLITRGFQCEKIALSDPNAHQLEFLSSQYQVKTTPKNTEFITGFDVFILAVKPQIVMPLLDEIKQALPSEALVISIAAGITIKQITDKIGNHWPVVRCMPNTPAIVHAGATALYANEAVTEKQKKRAHTIMSAIGMNIWLTQEEQLNAVTALSGSGPAYFFLIMEKMIETGIKMGLTPDIAKQLCLQTALGAAQLAITSEESPAVLRKNVTSPNGTTEKAIQTLEKYDIGLIFEEALFAAQQRAKDLSQEASHL